MVDTKAIKRELVLYDLGFPLSDGIKEYYIFIKNLIDKCDRHQKNEYDFILDTTDEIKEKYNISKPIIDYHMLISKDYMLDIRYLCRIFFLEYDLSIFEYSKKSQYVYMIIWPIVEHILSINAKYDYVIWVINF